jgi:hypothetical protein
VGKKIQGRLRYFGHWDWPDDALQKYEEKYVIPAAEAAANGLTAPPTARKTRRGANPRGPKPRKPYKTFPLPPLTNGQWGKRIRGEIKCFGPWRDPDRALKRFQAEKDDLYAGRMEIKKRLTDVTDHIHKWVFQPANVDNEQVQAADEVPAQ